MRFYHIWHKNSISHLFSDLTELFSAPTPKVLEKKMNNIFVICWMEYQIICEFVALLTKIWPKILIFTLQPSVGERSVMPPPLFTPRCY